jgi:hypothetical protein
MKTGVSSVLAMLFVLASARVDAAEDYIIIDSPLIGSNFNDSYTATPGRITEVDGTPRAQFPSLWFMIPANLMINLSATRASGDWDTKVWGEPPLEPLADELDPDGPFWRCTLGSWPNGNEGTGVVWQAPADGGPAAIELYEDDLAVNGPDSDDVGAVGYGIMQDSVTVAIYEIGVLSIASSGPVSNMNPGPNAQLYLDLWEDPDKWLQANQKSGGQYINTRHRGTARYEGSHLLAVGTGLKTEIKAFIDFSLYESSQNWRMPNGVLTAMKDDKEWRVDQYLKGGYTVLGQPQPGSYFADWTREVSAPYPKGNYRRAFNYDAPSDKGWVYFGDAPGLHKVRGTPPVGTDVTFNTDFKTGLVFFYNGVESTVLSPDSEENMWGVYGKVMYDGWIWRVSVDAKRKAIEP